MIVFKTFLKILKKNMGMVILYTVILVAFGAMNMKTNDMSLVDFQNIRPSIYMINDDQQSLISQNLVQYLEEQCEFVNLSQREDAIADALFYRDVSYFIRIPQNYGDDLLKGKNPEIMIESTNDYEASFAEMILSRYLEIAEMYCQVYSDEKIVVQKINDVLSLQTKIDMVSQVNTEQLSQASFYYNFISYSLLAGCLYVICSIYSSFREHSVDKRIHISSMSLKKHQLILLASNGLLAIVLWLIYVVLSFIFVKDVMLTKHGMIYMMNSFVFTICTLTIAFLIAQLLKNRNVMNGIVNVIALGSSFLCGAFVPVEFLPDFVLKIAHILPSYWYIQNNEMIETLGTIDMISLKPIFMNLGVICIFSCFFIVMSLVVAKRHVKEN